MEEGGGMLPMTKNTIPTEKYGRWKHYAVGAFFSTKGTGPPP